MSAFAWRQWLGRVVGRRTDVAPRSGTLVIQPLPGIGDMVWHLPHLHAIADASAEGSVAVLTKPRSLADRLLRADKRIGRILWLERNPGIHDGILGFVRFVYMLRRERLRCVWLLHGSARYAFAALLAGIPERIGYGRGLQKHFLSQPVTLSPQEMKQHPIDKADRLLTLSGVQRAENEPQLPLPAEMLATVSRRYHGRSMPWLAIGIGSSAPLKQWGRQRFTELCSALAGGTPATFFVIGGPSEVEMAHWISARLQAQHVGVVEVVDAPIDEVAALVAQCRAYIGNDTGVLNLAAAVGTPAVGLFGASRPLRHSARIHCVLPPGLDPHSKQGTGIYRDAEQERGMERITVAQVMSQVQMLGIL